MTSERTPTADGVKRAAGRLRGKAVRTPLIENAFLNEACGGRILVKAEMLQHYGSFKFRGAYNRLAQLSPEEKARGVLAWSSGNHAQGVALAARLVGTRAVIVMPADAPRAKSDNVRALGARIVTYDRAREDREAIGRKIAAEDGLALAPSYDHPDIIEGQGTLALEAVEQAAELGLRMEAFIVPCGGGGMAAGCALALAETSPSTELWIAEPEGYDETWASIRAGKRLRADPSRPTICDAIATPSPGEQTFPILQRAVRGGLTVAEDEVRAAMAFAFRRLKLVVEPGGAVALAALLAGTFDAKGRSVGITLSGGNVDAPVFAEVLKRFG